MIVLNVTYKCKPERREEFLEQIMTEGLDAASRDEAGNIKYDFYLSFDDDNELLLVEKWKDAEALAAHAGSEHFARIGEIKDEYVDDTIIEKFEC